MAVPTLTSITSVSQTLSLENNGKSLHDVSFSSYLNNSEENFVHKLPTTIQNVSPNVTAQEKHHCLGGNKEDDEEIGVFCAEKYFNGGMDESSPKIPNMVARKYQCKRDEPNSVVPITRTVHPGTPSVRSVTSWNSQSALLQGVKRNPSRGKINKIHVKSFLGSLCCNCSCSDKDSVDVNEPVGEISVRKSPNAVEVQGKAITKEHVKTSLDIEYRTRSGSWTKEQIPCQNLDKLGVGLKKGNCFTFPSFNSEAGNLPIKMQLREVEELKPRKSLEVFGSLVHEEINKTLSFERRLTKLSWDATPGKEEIEFPAASGGVYNDNESDASSDLFEIESVTGKVAPFLARQGSEATSGCVTPTTCYAPSEASIEWSVVTASAADFSVMSDYEELRPPTTVPSPKKIIHTATNAKTRTSREIPRRRSSILLGCKSHDAVRVAGDAYITNDKAKFEPQMCRVSDSCMPPMTRFQAETKLTGFDSRYRQHSLATHSLPRSNSPQSSRLFFIQ